MALRVTWASDAFPSRTSVTVGDTDQSSKQMLVCPVLRGNAGWKPSPETGSKAATLFLAGSPRPQNALGEDRTQEKLCDCL